MATSIAQRIRQIRGVEDVHLHQVMNVPKLHVSVDQTGPANSGSLSRTSPTACSCPSRQRQVQPNYWVDPKMGISYLVETRDADYKLDNVDAINGLPLTSQQLPGVQLPVERCQGRARCNAEVANH